jgi:hypothetical protein
MNKLQTAARKREQLIQQETAEWDRSAIIRQSLNDGFMPDEWHSGFFPPIDEPLPDIFFFQQSPEGLRPVVWWDYAYIGKQHFDVQEFILERTPKQDRAALLAQAEIDALRLRSEDNGQ